MEIILAIIVIGIIALIFLAMEAVNSQSDKAIKKIIAERKKPEFPSITNY